MKNIKKRVENVYGEMASFTYAKNDNNQFKVKLIIKKVDYGNLKVKTPLYLTN